MWFVQNKMPKGYRLQHIATLQQHALVRNLLKKIEKNKHDQDSITIADEPIKKVIKMHKDKTE
ncbi:MAG: hypothetical protein ABI663_14755 [Chryseolinea sp.]